MSGNPNSVTSRMLNRVFPRMPNFYGMLDQQCDLAVKAMEVFVQFMTDGTEDSARRVRELEKEGDTLKQSNMDVLNEAFATPMDREDIYRAIVSIDHIINYAKTTVREMEVLGLSPDEHMLELAQVLQQGAMALRDGYKKLSTSPSSADDDAQAVRKAERNAEKAYRRALAALFDEEKHMNVELAEGVGQDPTKMIAHVLTQVSSMFKRREVYRHLSNAGDRLARAGDALHDIVVKIS